MFMTSVTSTHRARGLPGSGDPRGRGDCGTNLSQNTSFNARDRSAPSNHGYRFWQSVVEKFRCLCLNPKRPHNATLRSFAAASAMMVVLFSGTAVLADDDEDNNNAMAQVMPFGFGNFGGMHIMALPIDQNADGIVSEAEASQHASTGFALFDGDEDGQISEDEYLDSATPPMFRGRQNVERLFVNRKARFNAMDADGDTQVTLAEFMAHAQTSYEAADANADGVISVWEFRAQQNPF